MSLIATEKHSLKQFIDKLPPKTKIRLALANAVGDTEGVAEDAEYIRKFYTSEKFESVLDTGDVVHYITSEEIDRDGEVVLIDGIQTEHFKGGVFFNHNYNLPVGKALWKPKRDPNAPSKMMSKTRFIGGDEFSDRVKKLFTEDVAETGPALSTWSIGFIPIKWRSATDDDKRKYGDGVRTVYEQVELIEYSAVGIPSNRAAVTIAVGKEFAGKLQEGLPDYLLPADDAESEEKALDNTVSDSLTQETEGEQPAEESAPLASVDEVVETMQRYIAQGVIDKAVAPDGAPSMHNVERAIDHQLLSMFPPTAGVGNAYVDDVYPETGTTGRAVICVHLTTEGPPKHYIIDYSYSDGRALISNPRPVEEQYVPKGLFAEKAGRVLSGKNRTLISNAVGSMSKASEALVTLLDETDNGKSADDVVVKLADEAPVIKLVDATPAESETIKITEPLMQPKAAATAEDILHVLKTALFETNEQVAKRITETQEVILAAVDEKIKRAQGRIR